jgi:hypothetical protein
MIARGLVAGIKETRSTFEESPRLLNWGCGDWIVPGWVNSDVKEGEGVVACDIREGLPFESDCFDYVVSIHALGPNLRYGPGWLEAVRRVALTATETDIGSLREG